VKSTIGKVSAGLLGAALLSTSFVTVAEAKAKTIPTFKVAYLSYAVANTYDAPMQAAALAAASGATTAHVSVTVFDANNDYTAQVSQIQDVTSSGQYQGIILQPIYGPAEETAVTAAITAGIKVVNIDQILGSSWTNTGIQVPGLSGNVVFAPATIGTQLGTEAIAACGKVSRCKVGLIHNYDGYEPDAQVTTSITSKLISSMKPKVTLISLGDGLYNSASAQTVAAGAIEAIPDLNVIVGSDQDCVGAQAALAAASNTTTKLVCYGGSTQAKTQVANGNWFADVVQAPATEGKDGMNILITAMLGKGEAGGTVANPVAGLPKGGVMLPSTVSSFTGQWTA
jgi:ribose transport system substrate-binding protein